MFGNEYLSLDNWVVTVEGIHAVRSSRGQSNWEVHIRYNDGLELCMSFDSEKKASDAVLKIAKALKAK